MQKFPFHMTALFLAGPALANPSGGATEFEHMWGAGYGASMVGFGMMFLFWGVFLLLIVVGVRWLLQQQSPQSNTPSALNLLQERFAKGEIDRKEFEERRSALNS